MDLKITSRIIAVIFLLFFCSCSRLFFYPESKHFISPSEIGLEYEDLYFESSGKKLHAWFLKAKGEEKGTILFLHGNAGNISSHIPATYWLPKHGYNVLMPDYRGYGKSEGSPQVDAIHQEAEIFLDYLNKRKKPFGVFGQSLGASVGIFAVANYPQKENIAFLIADSSFSSYRTILKEKIHQFFLLKPFSVPLSAFVENNYSADKYINKITPIPLLIIHGKKDEVVPFSHGELLFAKAKKPKAFWEIENGAHTLFLYENENTQKQLLNYIEEKMQERRKALLPEPKQ